MRLVASESVGVGHPDKICDQISDAILDACFTGDPTSRVACETFISRGLVIVGGEITTKEYVDVDKIVRQVIKDAGYKGPEYQFDHKTCAVVNMINRQSPDIAMGVDRGGAGDQGVMVGYATNDTDTYLPITLHWAHRLVKRLKEEREKGGIETNLGPDCKSQVVIREYGRDLNGKKLWEIDNVLVSSQHIEDDSEFAGYIRGLVVSEMGDLVAGKPIYVNPTGRFVEAGPAADTGLTGRKIIVDTYGGIAPHGGGAFSGKDPTKVDRSAAYMARYIAKNVVAAGLCNEATVHLAYAIGMENPVSVSIQMSEPVKSEEFVTEMVRILFPLTPKGIIEHLKLRRPIYRETSCFGHFGNSKFSWEQLDMVKEIELYIKEHTPVFEV